MTSNSNASPFVSFALGLGTLAPILYFGMQVAVAPYFPGFSMLSVTASELGSDRSPLGAWFNRGIMVQGLIALVASLGFFPALRRLGVHPLLAALTSAALAMNGVQCFWAAWYPMPDPRHGGHGVFVAAMLSLPLLLALSMWKAGGAVRWYFVANVLALAVIAPFMSGATGLDLNAYRGILQRTFALTIFVPIGVASLVLWQRRDVTVTSKEERSERMAVQPHQG